MPQEPVPQSEVLKTAWQLVKQELEGVYGHRVGEPDAVVCKSFYAYIEQAWGINVTLKFSVATYHGETYPAVEVSWSTTGFSPARAQAAIAAYKRMSDIACLLEAKFGDTTLCEDPKGIS